MSEGNDDGNRTDGLTWTESRGVLGGGVDRDGEGVAGANHLLCSGDAETPVSRAMSGLEEPSAYTLLYSKMAGRNLSWMSQTLLRL